MQLLRKATDDETPLKLALEYRLGAINELAHSLLSFMNEIGEASALNLDDGINLHHEVLRYESELIRRALQLTKNHQVRAAKMLNIKPTTLNSKIKRYKIQI